MDTDRDFEAARDAGATFAVVRVESADLEKAGTRSQTAVYRLAVEQMIVGSVPDAIAAKHFGPPRLAVGARHVVALVISQRFANAWQLVFHEGATVAPPPEAATDFTRRRALG